RRKIGFERDDPESLRLQLDLTAIDVNPRVHARLVLTRCLLVHGACRLELRPGRIDAGRGGDGLQVGPAHPEYDEITGFAKTVRRRGGGFLGGAIVSDGREIE